MLFSTKIGAAIANIIISITSLFDIHSCSDFDKDYAKICRIILPLLFGTISAVLGFCAIKADKENKLIEKNIAENNLY